MVKLLWIDYCLSLCIQKFQHYQEWPDFIHSRGHLYIQGKNIIWGFISLDFWGNPYAKPPVGSCFFQPELKGVYPAEDATCKIRGWKCMEFSMWIKLLFLMEFDLRCIEYTNFEYIYIMNGWFFSILASWNTICKRQHNDLVMLNTLNTCKQPAPEKVRLHLGKFSKRTSNPDVEDWLS